MSQGQDLYIWKTKYIKAHFCLKHQGLSCVLQTCSFSNSGSRGCLRLDRQGRSPASLVPAHALLGTAGQGLTGWRSLPRISWYRCQWAPRPQPGSLPSDLGYPKAPGPTGVLHRQPPHTEGLLFWTRHLHTHVPSAWSCWREEGLWRHLLGWGANTHLGFFLCPRNCGCSSKSIHISQLQAAKASKLDSALLCERCPFKTQDLMCGQSS